MNITSKIYLMLVRIFGFVSFLCLCFFLFQVFSRDNKEFVDFSKNEKNEIEAPFVAIPIELPQQNEVVILQPREIGLPNTKEVALPKQIIPKQNIGVVIKGATSALIPNSSGVIK